MQLSLMTPVKYNETIDYESLSFNRIYTVCKDNVVNWDEIREKGIRNGEIFYVEVIFAKIPLGCSNDHHIEPSLNFMHCDLSDGCRFYLKGIKKK